MTIEEYFGDWMKVIDKEEAMKIMGWLKAVNPEFLCPNIKDVFRAFKLCPYNQCKIIFIGQDPYPQKGIATGILFGNNKEITEDKLSPSLQVIKKSAINFEIPHNIITFDQTLESWAKQGILMLNSALTCEVNKIGSHVLQWRPFMVKFLKNMSNRETGIIYVLFGTQAKSFKSYISSLNDIIETEHPAYFARINKNMPSRVFEEINNIMYKRYNEKINWFKEI